MRSLAEASSRWQETLKYSSSLEDLQRATRLNGQDSPCISGCRSVCWKAFLLNRTVDAANWTHALLESRSSYASLREHFLKYLRHPEYLTAGSSDPLADDSDSPWNTYRQDEILQAEILQDVRRLPDEPFYHQPQIQALITDVLFIYCKLNPDVGGYRQGMHELLAPIVYVVEQDAIDPADVSSNAPNDLRMVSMLDASFVEHDSFAIFSKIMDYAKTFYASGEPSATVGNISASMQPTTSSIVERSRYIHETCLYKVDPELSTHLTNMEILPQIFLIRWIRLLFSREFPLDQMLVLWDTLFCIDPTFELIDLICTSMLLRIRWNLIEADYSVTLQLLLKYPPPQAPNGPHTFIDDAVYLRDHSDNVSGAELIMKYSGRAPRAQSTQKPATPKATGPSLRQRLAGTRSPLLSPSRFRQPPGGVEALFQGAAKNVLEQGEKFGINQAVRDAMVEIRRNVQEAKSSMRTSRDMFSEPRTSTAMRAVAAMDHRNRQLATLLDEPLSALRHLTIISKSDKSDDGDNQAAIQDSLDAVVAKLQFIKVYLEDSTLALPNDEEETTGGGLASPGLLERKVDSEPLSNAVAAMVLNTPMGVDSSSSTAGGAEQTPNPKLASELPPPTTATSPSSPDRDDASSKPGGSMGTAGKADADNDAETDPLGIEASSSMVSTLPKRPQAPIPTRSTLAQSSFAWMLEPDVSSSSSSSSSHPHPQRSPKSPSMSKSMFGPLPPSKSDTASRKQRASANANRERTAFLFGEVPSDADGNPIRDENIFGLENWPTSDKT